MEQNNTQSLRAEAQRDGDANAYYYPLNQEGIRGMAWLKGQSLSEKGAEWTRTLGGDSMESGWLTVTAHDYLFPAA